MTRSSSNNVQEDLHVITENGEQCFMWKSSQLTYIAQDREELPAILATRFGPLATKLDLSFNSLTSFNNINLFTNLIELILDNNCLNDDQLDFRQNLRLKTLSLNKNKLTDLKRLVTACKINFPNLEYLSLLGNPLCPGPSLNLCQNVDGSGSLPKPELHSTTTILVSETGRINKYDFDNQWNDEDFSDIEFGYQKYRLFIIYNMPNLRFLDSSQITDRERDEALRRCYWMGKREISTQEVAGTICQKEDTAAESKPEVAATICFQERNVSDDQPGNTSQAFQLLTIVTEDDQILTEDLSRNQQPRGAFSRLAYKYTGKNSEGNRFIRNQDL